MKRIAICVFLAVVFAAAAEAQDLGYLMAGPNAEYYFRRAYAPVDFALGQAGQYAGYGYYPYGYSGRAAAIAAGATAGMAAGAGIGAAVGHSTSSALIGAGAGAVAGGLITHFATRPSQPAAWRQATAADYQQQQVVFAAPKPQKPLDCTKPRGKRGKNEAACAAAEQQAAERQQVAERQSCLDRLASSYWRARNGSAIWPMAVTVNDQPLIICGEPLVLRPLQTVRIFPPDGQIGGKMLGAGASGEPVEFTAKIRAVNQPGFVGFILLPPCEERDGKTICRPGPEGGN